MKIELEVTYTGIPSESFVLEAFSVSKKAFSDSFKMEYIGRIGNKYTYSIMSKSIRDIYVAGMIGAKIEQILIEQKRP